MRNRIGEIARRRRRAALVGDYSQLLALLRASRTIVLRKLCPNSPYSHDVRRRHVAAAPVAPRLRDRLAVPVGTDRVNRIALQVRSRFGTVEHVVGRDVQERDFSAGTGARRDGGAVRIGLQGRGPLGLGAVYIGEH